MNWRIFWDKNKKKFFAHKEKFFWFFINSFFNVPFTNNMRMCVYNTHTRNYQEEKKNNNNNKWYFILLQ